MKLVVPCCPLCQCTVWPTLRVSKAGTVLSSAAPRGGRGQELGGHEYINGTMKVGIVERVEFTSGGAGNLWTTIEGVTYATWWDAREADWKVGDRVRFEERMQVIPLHGDKPRALPVTALRRTYWTRAIAVFLRSGSGSSVLGPFAGMTTFSCTTWSRGFRRSR